MNARTSILASANPIHSKFDPKRSVVENINLDPPLLSRFDLIFLLLDKPNEENDRRLGKHIVGLFETISGAGSFGEREFLVLNNMSYLFNPAKSII